MKRVVWTKGQISHASLDFTPSILAMNALASKFRSVAAAENDAEDDIQSLSPSLWGSQGGFGNLQANAPPEFALPNLSNVRYALN